MLSWNTLKVIKFSLIFVLTGFGFWLVNSFYKKNPLDFQIQNKAAKQGEIYQILISSSVEPLIEFNGSIFRAYPIGNGNIYRALVPIENLSKPALYFLAVTNCNKDGKIYKTNNCTYKETLVEIKDAHRRIDRVTLDTNRDQLKATETELENIEKDFSRYTVEKLWAGKFIYPSKARKSTPFGVQRAYNGGPVTRYHKGVDFAAWTGDPVLAPNNGIITLINRRADSPWGKHIVMDHGHGVSSIFMHLSKVNVNLEDKVAKGQKIAEVGHTGWSSGPHLHWGLSVNSMEIDPELFVHEDIL